MNPLSIPKPCNPYCGYCLGLGLILSKPISMRVISYDLLVIDKINIVEVTYLNFINMSENKICPFS